MPADLARLRLGDHPRLLAAVLEVLPHAGATVELPQPPPPRFDDPRKADRLPASVRATVTLTVQVELPLDGAY